MGDRNGFTLIEVLIAMVILAVGLLGLEALGVSAVRSLGLAQRNSEASAAASHYLEEAIGQLTQYQEAGTAALPEQFCLTTPFGKASQRIVLSSGGQVVRVTVTITPRTGGTASPPLITTSHYFSSKAINASDIAGSPCA